MTIASHVDATADAQADLNNDFVVNPIIGRLQQETFAPLAQA